MKNALDLNFQPVDAEPHPTEPTPTEYPPTIACSFESDFCSFEVTGDTSFNFSRAQVTYYIMLMLLHCKSGRKYE